MEDYSTLALAKRYFPPYLLDELWVICLDYLTYKIMDASDGIKRMHREINGVEHGAIYHYLRNGRIAYKYYKYLGAPSGEIKYSKGNQHFHEEYYKGYIKYYYCRDVLNQMCSELKVSGIDEDITQKIGEPSKLTIEFTEYSDDKLPSIIYTVKNGIGFCRITQYKRNMFSLYNFKAIKSEQQTALNKLDTLYSFKCRIPIREIMHGVSEHINHVHYKSIFDNGDRTDYRPQPPLHGMIIYENNKQYSITSLDYLPMDGDYEMYTYYRGVRSGLFITKEGYITERGRYYKDKLDGLVESYNDGSLIYSSNYCRGKQHGPQFKFVNDKLVNIENYYKGKLHGQQTTFRLDGLIQSIINYWHGMLHGISVQFHSNGQIKNETYYCNGEGGVTRSYDSDGTIDAISTDTVHFEFYGEFKTIESQYRNGTRHGKTTKWYQPSGRVISIHNYENDEMHGEFIEYNIDGSVRKSGTYYKGYISSCHSASINYENGVLEITEDGGLIKKKLPKGTLLIL